MWKKIRKIGRVVHALNGFVYDFKRFCFYSAWKADMRDKETRNYYIAQVYHSLEKSLSFTNRNTKSGWSTAKILLEIIVIANRTKDLGCHDAAGLSVLKKFIEHPDNSGKVCADKIREVIKDFKWDSEGTHGAKSYKKDDFFRGKLQDPEAFFLSRYSLREFRQVQVAPLLVERAISLAMKTPSVCNRQAWHVYHSDDQDTIKKALSYQEGNRGFGDQVPNLMIIAADLKAFMPGRERYQHWIDGGLFSMSLIYSFHSLGIASCCLNWSQSPSNDLKLRSAFNIRPNDTVVMMLAFGYPHEESQVCVSARRPLEEIYSKLEIKSI